MSKISDLIAKLCPNGVEYKKLGDVADICRGVRVVRKELLETGKYEVFQNSLKPLGRYDRFNVKGKTAFVIGAGAAGEIGYSENDFWAADDCYYIDGGEKLMGRYAYYCLTSRQDWLASKVRKASIPRLARDFVKALVIPVPPVKIQREVVEVLDKFALLTAELTAELEKRKRQYEHYRDKLLKFTPPLAEITIFDACEICRGRVMSKKYLRDNAGEYPVFSSQTANGGVFGCISTYDFDGEYVTWTTDGANAGSVFYHDGKFSITNVCGLLKSKRSDVLIKFVFYWLQVVAKNYVSSGMGNPKLMSNVMGRIKIPLPPLAEQERIVKILDKFDKLCNDLTSGLPAEIAARKKQYEYYRDKLLNFKRAA